MNRPSEDLEIIRTLITQARQLEETHPGPSITSARSATEAIIRFALRTLALENGEQLNLDKMSFEEVSTELFKRDRDSRIQRLVKILQDNGNLAAHPPKQMKSLPQQRDAHACVTTLQSLAVWYAETYATGDSETLWPEQPVSPPEPASMREGDARPPAPEVRPPTSAPVSTRTGSAESGRAPGGRGWAGQKLHAVAGSMVALTLLGALVAWAFGRKAPSTQTPAPPTSTVRVAEVLHAPPPKDADARRIAVLYFDDHSRNQALAPLRTGLTDMLISDLDGARAVRVIERERLNTVLKELDLQASATVDPDTSQRIGRILGVEFLLLGSYFELMGQLRVDARLVRVETGEIVRAEGVTGTSQDLFALERQLALKILQGLGARLDQGEEDLLKKARGADLPRLLAYARALDLYDRGDRRAAVSALEEVVRQAPAFPQAERSLTRMRDRL